MSTASASLEPGDRVPMTWEQYLALGEDPRIEYVDGCAVMSPFGTSDHARCIRLILRVVEDVLPPEYEVLTGFGWKPGRDEWGPDAIVVPRTSGLKRFTGIPPMVCEVLSEDRSRDLVKKLRRYEQAGAPQYWVVDPRDREILGFENTDDGFEEYARVDAEHPTAAFRVAIGDGIPVALTYDAFFT
jgi:Uma2 family endonuclease